MDFVNQSTGIHLSSVYVTNLFGIVLMTLMLFSKGWQVQTKNKEGGLLLAMIFTTMIGCLTEPTTFTIDGMDGTFFRVLNIFLNSVLFLLNVVIGPGYITIISRHINVKLKKTHYIIIGFLIILELVMLISNPFLKLIFVVDENNIYQRRDFFWIYVAIESGLMCYGLFIYFAAKLKGNMLRFFPAWQFFIPIVIGMVLQGYMYGVSVIWPFIGIALCNMMVSLQNESIFLDKLTGVYNRYYLDEIKKALGKRRKGLIAALMLDMNGFKEINDKYSHAEGDIALINVARILQKALPSNGTVVRFAGDEFVVIVNTQKPEILDEIKNRINELFDEYNKTSGKPYELSASVGGDIFDLKNENVSDFLNDIDHLMYKEKAEYYKSHNRRSR